MKITGHKTRRPPELVAAVTPKGKVIPTLCSSGLHILCRYPRTPRRAPTRRTCTAAPSRPSHWLAHPPPPHDAIYQRERARPPDAFPSPLPRPEPLPGSAFTPPSTKSSPSAVAAVLPSRPRRLEARRGGRAPSIAPRRRLSAAILPRAHHACAAAPPFPTVPSCKFCAPTARRSARSARLNCRRRGRLASQPAS